MVIAGLFMISCQNSQQLTTNTTESKSTSFFLCLRAHLLDLVSVLLRPRRYHPHPPVAWRCCQTRVGWFWFAFAMTIDIAPYLASSWCEAELLLWYPTLHSFWSARALPYLSAISNTLRPLCVLLQTTFTDLIDSIGCAIYFNAGYNLFLMLTDHAVCKQEISVKSTVNSAGLCQKALLA